MTKMNGFVAALVLSFLVLLFTAATASAQNEVELLLEAVEHLQAEEYAEAEKLVDKAKLSLWNKSSLQLTDLVFTDQEVDSIGVYRERPSSFFASGETMYFYAEPKYYTIREDDESYHIYFTADLSIYDREGTYLIGEKDLLQFRFMRGNPVYDVFITIALDVDSLGLDAGDYFLEITVTDRFSQESTSGMIPFRL